MSRKLTKGAQVEADHEAFPGAAGYTPYLVIGTHKDGTVDLALRDENPTTAVATRVKPRHLNRID